MMSNWLLGLQEGDSLKEEKSQIKLHFLSLLLMQNCKVDLWELWVCLSGIFDLKSEVTSGSTFTDCKAENLIKTSHEETPFCVIFVLTVSKVII